MSCLRANLASSVSCASCGIEREANQRLAQELKEPEECKASESDQERKLDWFVCRRCGNENPARDTAVGSWHCGFGMINQGASDSELDCESLWFDGFWCFGSQ
jgi:ribosomal protein L37E